MNVIFQCACLVLLAATTAFAALTAVDHHTDAPWGTKNPGDQFAVQATPPGTPISGDVVNGNGWPWIKESFVRYSVTIPSSYAGTHTATFAGEYVVSGGTGPGRALTWDMDAYGTVNKPLVTITTQGSVELCQEADSKASLTAERKPSGGQVVWSVSGPGADFVDWSAEGTNPSTITIFIKQPVSNAWEINSFVVARASDSENSSTYDERIVPLKKFMRDSKTMPGSKPIHVPLVLDGPNGYIEMDGDSGIIEVAVFEELLLEITERTTSDSKEADWKAGYKGSGDQCRGTRDIRALGRVRDASGRCLGGYQGFGHEASVDMAVGVAAGADNDALPISNSSCGTGYEGTPIAHSINLGISVSGTKLGAGLGYSVAITASEQDSLDISCTPSGQSVIAEERNISHAPGVPFSIQKIVRAGASAVVKQIVDGEWGLTARINMTYNFAAPGSEIVFTPDI